MDSWNPMAEDYGSSSFNNYSTVSNNKSIDPRGLYIMNVPVDLTEEEFIKILSEGNRKLLKAKLLPPKEGKDTTVGLCTYESEEDARNVLLNLNKKAPYNFTIQHSKLKEKKEANNSMDSASKNRMKENGSSNDATTKNRQNPGMGRGRPPANSNDFKESNKEKFGSLSNSNNGTIPIGAGRGTALQNFNKGHKIISHGSGFNSNESKHSNYEPRPIIGRGRSVLPLQVTVGGSGTRIVEEKENKKNLSNLPSLVGIECISCRQSCTLACMVCRRTYCSYNCQEKDWPFHKNICQSITVDEGKPWYKKDVESSPNERSHMKQKISLDFIPGSVMRNQTLVAAEKEKEPVTQPPPCPKPNIIKANEIPNILLQKDSNVKVRLCHAVNPSCFWIHLENADKILSSMERELSKLVNKNSMQFESNDVCAAIYEGKVKRAKVIERKAGRYDVAFLDYGGRATVASNSLSYLPEKFKVYDAQAICCNLVSSSKSAKYDWSKKELEMFQKLDKKVTYKALIGDRVNDVYNVSLSTENSTSVTSIIESASNKVQSSPVPGFLSVYPNIKEGSTVIIAPMAEEDDKILGVFSDESNLTTEILKQIEISLENLKTKEVIFSTEEGDIAAAFSPEYKVYYRCLVLKRLKNKFKVFYIDYGSTEEVECLRELPTNLDKKPSLLVQCLKPSSLTSNEFKSAFKKDVGVEFVGVEVVIKSVKGDSVVTLLKTTSGKSVELDCLPWYHGLLQSDTYSTPPPAACVNGVDTVKSAPAVTVRNKIMSSTLKDEGESLAVQSKHSVMITFREQTTLYVQLEKNKEAIASLSIELNKHCNSAGQEKYDPSKNEIVCCKFSDNVWYRGEVLKKAGNMYSVFFIDYGNTDLVPDKNIRFLPEKFAMQKFCVGTSVSNVSESEFTNELISEFDKLWLMEVKDVSKKPIEVMLFLENKSLTDIIYSLNHKKTSLKNKKLSSKEKTNVLICHAENDKLFLHQTSDGTAIISLSEKVNSFKSNVVKDPQVGIVYSGLASDGLWYRVIVEEVISDDKSKVNFVDFGNFETISSTNLKVLPNELFSLPVYSIPVFAENIDISKLVQNKEYAVEVVGEKEGTQIIKFLNLPAETSPHPLMSSFKKTCLKDGSNDVLFLHVDETSTFFCCLKQDYETIVKISDILKDVPKIKVNRKDLVVGSVVAAKSSDGSWYRAAIVSISESSCNVSFIDYGNSEDINFDDLASLPEEHCSRPIFSIPVQIGNLSAAKDFKLYTLQSVKISGMAANLVQIVQIELPDQQNLPMVNSLQKLSLPKDEPVKVLACYEELDVIYVHMASSFESLIALQTELQKGDEFSNLSAKPLVNNVVCAKSSDGCWYRAYIKECTNQGYKVCFFDYGNTELVTISSIKVLPSKALSFPISAIPVKLHDIEQVKNISKENLFDIKVVEDGEITVVELYLENKVEEPALKKCLLPDLPVEVIISHHDKDVYYVQKASDQKKLEELLVELQSIQRKNVSPKVGLLVSAVYEGCLYRAIIKEIASDNSLKAFFVDYGNTDSVNVNDVFVLPREFAAKPMFSVAVTFINKFPPLTLNTQHIVKYTGKSINDILAVEYCHTFVPIQFSSLKQCTLQEGIEEVCFVSHDSVNHYVIRTNDLPKKSEMDHLIENFSGSAIQHVPSVDEVLLAKSNGQWHRCCIKSVQETSGACKVFFFDIGLTENIPISQMFCMPEDWIQFPVFAIKTILEESEKSEVVIGLNYKIQVTMTGSNFSNIKMLQTFSKTALKFNSLPVGEPREVLFVHKEEETFYLQDVQSATYMTGICEEIENCTSPLSREPLVNEIVCAQSQDGVWYRACIDEVLPGQQCKVQFIDYGNFEVISTSKLRSCSKKLVTYPCLGIAVVFSEVPKVEVSFEKLFMVTAQGIPQNNCQKVKMLTGAENGFSSQSSREVNTELLFNDSSLLSSETFHYADFPSSNFPAGDQDVCLLHVIDDRNAFCSHFSPEALSARDDMEKDILAHCLGLKSDDYNGLTLPNVGDMVLAKFEEKWYRCTVLEKEHQNSDILYSVVSVDEGFVFEVPKGLLRKMEKRFMALRFQAHLCELIGYAFKEKESENIKTELHKFVNSKLRAVVFKTEDDSLQIKIPDVIKHLEQKGLVIST